jgi:hypothetical protein
MLALLEGERQAFAALDLERILTCAEGKSELCSRIDLRNQVHLDEESRGLLDAVQRLNDINRRTRNLISANVEARLSALTGRPALYDSARPAALREMPRQL